MAPEGYVPQSERSESKEISETVQEKSEDEQEETNEEVKEKSEEQSEESRGTKRKLVGLLSLLAHLIQMPKSPRNHELPVVCCCCHHWHW